MLQEDAAQGWDPANMHHPVPSVVRVYIIFLLIICFVALVKLIRTWIAIPPFAKPSTERQQSGLALLQAIATSLHRWLGLTLLLFSIVTSLSIARICIDVATLSVKTTIRYVISEEIAEWSAQLELALFVVAFLYLIRWYILNRIERFRK